MLNSIEGPGCGHSAVHHLAQFPVQVDQVAVQQRVASADPGQPLAPRSRQHVPGPTFVGGGDRHAGRVGQGRRKGRAGNGTADDIPF